MRILSLFILMLLQQALDAATWYASPAGNDNNTGSLASPFRNLSRAIDAASPGDVIELRGGQYSSQEVRIDKSNLTIRSYPGEWAILTAPLDDEDIASCIWYNDPSVSGGLLENLEIIGGYYYGVSFETNWDWGVTPVQGASNITLRHCKVHDTGRDCIKIKPACNNIQLLSCELYRSGVGPSNTPENGGPNAEGIDNVNGDGMVVRHCYIHHTSTSGVYAKGGAQNCIIEENLVSHTGEAGILLGFYTDAEFFDQDGSNPQYYECNYSLARNNIVIDTRGAGIGLFAARNCAVYHNTVITASPDFHAPLYLSPGEIWIDDNTTLYPANFNITVTDNIFVDESGTGEDDFTAQIREGGLSGINTINRNVYYKKAGAARFDDGVSWPALDFAQWKSTLQIDLQSQEIDPRLDAQAHLLANSPAINAARTTPATTDYDSRPRTASPDIGADEYNNGAALPVPPPAGVIGTGAGDNSTAIAEIPLLDCRVFPNPATSRLYLELPQSSADPQIRLYSPEGKLLLSGQGSTLDVSSLTSGLYFLQVKLGQAEARQPVLILEP